MHTRIMAVALVCGGFMAIAGQPPTTWFVDDDCVAPGSGTEADPYCLIQDCIDAAVDGDECIVAPGTYFENINILGKAITLHSIEGPLVTTINAGGSGRVIICYNGEEADTVISGFAITGGNTGGGSGMFNNNSSPTVTNCIFYGNMATSTGAGMSNWNNSSPTVTNCTFIGNTASFRGGGMLNKSSSNPTVTNCTFHGNSADAVFGGGMVNEFSSPTVTNCIFSGNTAGTGGGGMSNGGGSPVVTNCTFIGNTAGLHGGGMFNFNTSSPVVTNCTFIGNDADNGRALAFDSFRQQLPSDFWMSNCILWDGGDEVWNNDNSMISIAYSDVRGGWAGEGNIDLDPLFADPASGDLHLSTNSPCIDAADNSAVPEGITTDLDGNPRFVDDPTTDDTGFGDPPIVDMGAYEFRDPCADDDGDGRVTICHVPPGNPDNPHTIAVSPNALPAHLAHGDQCGPCEEGDLPLSGQGIAVPSLDRP